MIDAPIIIQKCFCMKNLAYPPSSYILLTMFAVSATPHTTKVYMSVSLIPQDNPKAGTTRELNQSLYTL